MIKITVLFTLISGLVLADVAIWKKFKTAEKYFVMELPCVSDSNPIVKTDENKTERLYKCSFADADYSVTQVVYTEAGRKKLESRPSTLIEQTAISMASQYKKDGINIDKNVNHREHPYRILEFFGTGNKKNYFTKVYDGSEAQLIFTGIGPTTEEYNLKHVVDSIKPN